MHASLKLLGKSRSPAAVAAAMALLLILADPVSADENDKADITEADLTQAHEQEQGAAGYYDDQARNTQKRSDAMDREAANYYEEQARRAKEHAEELDREAAKYYGE